MEATIIFKGFNLNALILTDFSLSYDRKRLLYRYLI